MTVRIVLYFVVFILMTGCSKSTPELSDAELNFSDVLTDVYLVNGLSNQLQKGNKDSFKTHLLIQVLNKHDLDTTKFFKTLYQLEKDPVKMKIIYDTAIVRLERLRKD